MQVLGLLGLSVYDDEAGSSLIVYTKFERVSLNDRQTDGQTDRQTDKQTDALLEYAQACIFLSCLTF